MEHIKIRSSLDNTDQPCGLYAPAKAKRTAVPLVIGLHQWSFDFAEQSNGPVYMKECRKRGWALAYPNFRGPNNQPEACGSNLAVQDVLDAVEFMKANYKIDEKRIFLVGCSGGGMMTLVMAGRAPKLWAAASAWVPILDLAAWHADGLRLGNGYPAMMESACGGAPGDSVETKAQYKSRSPVTYLKKAAGLPMDINAGIHDGHTGSVPISHSLNAFNILAKAVGHDDRMLTKEQIQFMTETESVPPRLASRSKDESGRMHKILFRRQAGQARITIFEGGHDVDPQTAFRWLDTKRKR